VNHEVTERKQAEIQLKKSLKEKEILLQEVHHRVKNNLQIISSLLDLQADTMEDPRIIKLLKENQGRVHSLALLYDNLSQSRNLARIDMNEYIHDIVAYLFSFAGNPEDRVTYNLDIAFLSLGMDVAIPLGLILTELVFNALIHAFPGDRHGEIGIHLSRQKDNEIILKVWDNGIGLPEKPGTAEDESLGLQLVSLLTKQLSGQLDVQSTGGTSFSLTFQETGDIEKESIHANSYEYEGVT
jgi:two-component sensor histidine kinase